MNNDKLRERVLSANKGAWIASAQQNHINVELINDLFAALEDKEAEVTRLNGRDCKATVLLRYSEGDNPFASETLKVIDVGVSDNVYVVESKTVTDMQAKLADGK